MLKTHQMKLLVGAAIGMLMENLEEETNPEVKAKMEEYKTQMEEMYEQILFAEFMEHMMKEEKVES